MMNQVRQPWLTSNLIKLMILFWYISMKIKEGRAFVEFIDDSTPCSLQLFVNFRGQRLKSKAVQGCLEPKFNAQFLFRLQDRHSHSMATPHRLSRIKEQIQIIVLRTEPDGEVNVMSSQQLEWRRVLSQVRWLSSIELQSYGGGERVPVGLLDVELELLPP
eukprot:127625_1